MALLTDGRALLRREPTRDQSHRPGRWDMSLAQHGAQLRPRGPTEVGGTARFLIPPLRSVLLLVHPFGINCAQYALLVELALAQPRLVGRRSWHRA